MPQVIVFTNEKGNVTVCIPSQESIDAHGIEWIKEKDTPQDSIIIEYDLLPNSYDDFFDAWRLVQENVVVDFPAAQEITKNRLRLEREPLMQEQDVAFQRALESGSDTTAIVTEKQRLRNITKLADGAKTLEELQSIKVV